MNTFQHTVLTISIIILIISLAWSGYGLVKKKQDAQWPPVIASCPDYWVQNEDGMCVPGADFPKDSTDCETAAPRAANNLNTTEKRSLKQWATNCNLSWDGITNSNFNEPTSS